MNALSHRLDRHSSKYNYNSISPYMFHHCVNYQLLLAHTSGFGFELWNKYNLLCIILTLYVYTLLT